jgi:hypothetical protein
MHLRQSVRETTICDVLSRSALPWGCRCGSKRCHTAVQGERGETMRVHEDELPEQCGLDPMIYVYELPPRFNTWLVADPDPGASFGTRELFVCGGPHSSTPPPPHHSLFSAHTRSLTHGGTRG